MSITKTEMRRYMRAQDDEEYAETQKMSLLARIQRWRREYPGMETEDHVELLADIDRLLSEPLPAA